MDNMAKKERRSSETQFSRQDAIDFALMAQDIANIKTKVNSIDETLKDDYVKKEEFTPVKNLVYGFVVLIVVAVIGAILALVIIRPGEPTQLSPSISTQSK